MIDRLLVTVFALIVTVIILMQLMMLSMPFFRKIEYDRICHTYVVKMEQQGGLDSEQQINLVNQLNERGFQVLSLLVSLPQEEIDLLTFTAECTWSGWSLQGLERIAPKTFTFSYQAALPNRYLPVH